MPGKTYKTRALVLRKVKVGEKDLILTLLSKDGSLVRGVAKGARKPGGSYAGKLDLFSCADLMLAAGRSLDVITDARRATATGSQELGMEQSACASALAELLGNLAQEGLPNEKLYALSEAAFSMIAESTAAEALSIATAAMLKALAVSGLRPSFNLCVACASPVSLEDDAQTVLVSVLEGGVVCPQCSRPADAVAYQANTVRWAHALLMSTYANLARFDIAAGDLLALLNLVQQWSRVHVGRNLKSLDFIFSSGLF